MFIYSQEEFEELVFRSHRAGLQLAVHAIGDKAIDMANDWYIIDTMHPVEETFSCIEGILDLLDENR